MPSGRAFPDSQSGGDDKATSTTPDVIYLDHEGHAAPAADNTDSQQPPPSSTQWACTQCTLLNDAEKQSCEACGTCHTGHTARVTISRSVWYALGTMCHVVPHLNSHSYLAAACHVTHSGHGATLSPGRALQPGDPGYKTVEEETYACKRCTLVNSKDSARCEACGTPRDSSSAMVEWCV